MNLLERVTRVLRDDGVPFALIGASAMAVHGVSRSTQDVDLLTTFVRCLDERFWSPLNNQKIAVDVRKGDDDDPLLGVVRFSAPGQSPVDLVVGRGSWQLEILKRAQPQYVADLEVPVVTADDLVLLKLYAGGVQDRWDIQQLLAVSESVREKVEARLDVLPDASRALWTKLVADLD